MRRRGGLQRTLFVASGVAILATGATVGGVLWALGDRGGWRDEIDRAERFAAGRFGAVWEDDAARADLARSIERDLRVGVRVAGSRGETLDEFGMPDDCRAEADVAVPGRGTVLLCLDAHRGPPRPWTLAVALGLAGVVLWAFAGRFARRLARPLRELADVARELGEGKLDRRARLRHGLRGEVGDLAHAVNEMAARIERQIRAERELLATVSHEMRTPLSRIRLLLEMGREGARRDVLGEIEKEVVEMDALVGDLLAGARIDFGAVAPRECDPRAVAARALERAGLPADALVDAGDPGPLLADETLLARALASLLDNARRHGGGRVTLRVERRDARVAFEVEDEGPGHPDGDPTRLFEPFARGDASRGTGLGLAIVRRIAEAHGGRAYAARRTPGSRVGFEV